MKYIVQIDSEVNIPYIFGDYGCGHITQCSEYKDIFGFKFASH